MSEYTCLAFEKQGHIAEVYLNRPEKRNAMGLSFWSELPRLFKELDRDRGVRAIVLAARGKTFCGGLDLTSLANVPEINMSEPDGQSKMDFVAFVRGWQEAITEVERCRKPVIAAVHGGCVGGGLDLIAACDVRLSTQDAFFSLREAAVAMIADLGSLQRLPLIIGQGLTRELAFTARDVSAQEALHMRLVNRVFETQEALMDGARKMASQIAAQSPLAVQSSKAVLNYSRSATVEDGLHYAVVRNSVILPSEDLFEAIQAFMEKRKPQF